MTTLRPDDYQDPNDPAAQAAEDHEKEIAAGILIALAAFRRALSLEKITLALGTANLAGVEAQLPYGQLADDLDTAAEGLSAVYVDAERAAAKIIALPYDRTSVGGLTDLDLYRNELLADIRQSVGDGILETVRAAVRQHTGLATVAQAIRDTVGLTPRQAQAVANFRAALEAGDGSALNRALRDQRFDATVRRLINGETVAETKIDRMVDRYAERQLAYRARMIAQTEAVKVSNAAVRAAYELAVQRGLFSRNAIKRHWQVSLSEGTCALCLSIPILNPLGVGMDEEFMSIEGPVSEPVEDTHPNCRCSIKYRIASMSLRTAA